MEPYEDKLTVDKRKLDFIIDPEDPYLELKVNATGDNHPKNSKRAFASIKISIKKINLPEEEKIFNITNQEVFPFNDINQFIPKVDNSSFERISLELLEGNTIEEISVHFSILKGMRKINMLSPFEQFHAFISDRINSKVLFSAPYGSGKSTFLDYYFNSKSESQYNVFTLYPVNYSVTSSEDVFKYIKADILLQLLATDVEFDKESISFIQATEEYLYFKPKKAILSFLDKVSSLNPKTNLLRKALGKLNLLAKEISEYQKAQEIDDKGKAVEFIRDIYEKEGSLFEDNFFTQLIRQLLEQLKNKTTKENVLIIEDLDRMDPDHIFRILNVISAHYDTFKFSDEELFPNKFGFNKIIIVCDLKNIQSIYHHKYGANTEFHGYIDKYFSSKPFEFSNLKNIKQYLEKIVEESNQKQYKDPRIESYGIIIKLLLESDQLTLREMLKLLMTNFESYDIPYPTHTIEYSPYYKVIVFLIDLYGSDTLKKKFSNIKTKIFKSNINFNYVSLDILIGLGKKSSEKEEINTNYDRYFYKLSYDVHFNYPVFINVERIEEDPPLVSAGSTKKAKFVKVDFIELINRTIDEIVLMR